MRDQIHETRDRPLASRVRGVAKRRTGVGFVPWDWLCTLLCTFGFANPEEDSEIIPGNKGQKPPTYSDSVETAALWRVC